MNETMKCDGSSSEHRLESGIREPLISVLIDQALRDEKLIGLMAEAVRQNDKDRVFVLAKELTNAKQ